VATDADKSIFHDAFIHANIQNDLRGFSDQVRELGA
jgi:hypothetical protein